VILLANNLSELKDKIIAVQLHCNHSDYPTEYQTYNEAWESIFQSLDKLKGRLGDRYEQLVDMAKQAKTHYDAAEHELSDQAFWASWLMQDIEQIVRGKPPFAYPEDKYRWPKVNHIE